MRIRPPFAGAFALLLLLSGYAGLSSLQVDVYINDKVLHLFTFFLLTVAFYWVVDTNRRRTLNLTLIVCTVCLGIGSEFLQSLLPNGRNFDVYDIVANLVGSLAGLGLCTWYHKRMLERRRHRRQYSAVAGDESTQDLELGEGVGTADDHEEGVTGFTGAVGEEPEGVRTMREEANSEDNWDENTVDAWESGDIGEVGGTKDHA
ncbi:hypothetical protein VTK73DRAFT_6828 [Phialemonium thermophilum]|uniref:VanZ-like domain-containing protein n=1 Tax=Phialemonium thermophilum TaxID=223376 RepID=A0ABR3Y7Z8_9PEZI